jgi:pimeloyl-ACP methyl ester carboxylesterase
VASTFIQNRKGQRIAVVLERNEQENGLAFVMHGLGGFKEQPHVEMIAQSFFEKGFTVVRFDTTNTFGESAGQYEDATTTNYYEDLEDVITWAKSQPWYQEAFVLTGHSLGGFCTAQYAENYPARILALAPVSPVVSGQFFIKRYEIDAPQVLEEWQRTGYHISESVSKPGTLKKLKWSFIEDGRNYDLLPDAKKLTMPVLLIVGERDDSTPAEFVKFLYDVLPGPKELHIIKNAPHTFREPAQLEEVRKLFSTWIDSWMK